MKRRSDYCVEVGLKNFGVASVDSPFSSRLVCGHCGEPYGRKCWSNRQQFFWGCRGKGKKDDPSCPAENVKDEVLRKAVVIAWNCVVKERNKLLPTWEAMKKAGDSLQKMRVRQMTELTDQGPLVSEVPELTRTVLERIIIHNKKHFTIRFLDGTEKEVCIVE